MKNRLTRLIPLLLALLLTLSSCITSDMLEGDLGATGGGASTSAPAANVGLSDLPAYSGSPYVALNGNVPAFTTNQYTTSSYEFYSKLDVLRRCGVAMACVGVDLMPTSDRESISSVRPSGWQSVKYDIVDGKYLYNRCHLIGFQLTGENANEKNLITGTRYMNVDGMLPFENMIADYVKETKNHVLLRVTPIFYGNELVARGVQMEAWSVEDGGDGICFNVFVYNVQPGITIDYATGKSQLGGAIPSSTSSGGSVEQLYILNISSKKFHLPTCSYAQSIKEDNRGEFTGKREDLILQDYDPCGTCNP